MSTETDESAEHASEILLVIYIYSFVCMSHSYFFIFKTTNKNKFPTFDFTSVLIGKNLTKVAVHFFYFITLYSVNNRQ